MTFQKTTAFILVTLIAMISFSCSQEKEMSPPTLTLKTGFPFTPNNSVIAVGGAITFGISAKGTDANITNLVVKKIMPDKSTKVVFDTGMNTPSFDISKVFYQSVEDTAQWTVQIMDKNRQFATTMLTLYRDPNSTWGGIFEYESITLGYQGNLEYGQFLDPMNGKSYFSDSAALVQSSIHIITYYYEDDFLPSPTFSSAGEQGGGIMEYYPSINEWTQKNATKWDISVDTHPIDPAAYQNCHNDSLLITGYDDVWGKRKFKWSEPGDIIPFMTATGKKGMLKVNTADHEPKGKITFSLKIQQ